MVVLVAVVPLRAQTTDPINSSLQFNFSNPGARSLGLAGAFTARADDATAVYANPAGLIQLSQSEISLELRGWDYSTSFIDGGVQSSEGSLDGLSYSDSSDSTSGLSFLSALYPTKSGRWVFGLFRHEYANFKTEVHSDGARLFSSNPNVDQVVRPVDGFYELDIESFGFSTARRLTKSFSLGATLTYSRFELDSRVERWNHFRDEPLPGDVPAEAIEADPEKCCQFTDRANIAVYLTQVPDSGEDDDLTLTLGMLWESPRKVAGAHLVTVGGVYRQGPEYGFLGDSFRQSEGPVNVRSFVAQTQFEPFQEECREPDRAGCPGRFNVPDVFGIGVSVRPSLRWVLAFDANYITYSDLTDEILDIDKADSALEPGELGPPADFEIDDGIELRLGAEYGIYRERSMPDIQLRGGLWLDPDHEMRYTGPDPDLQAVWTRGSDELHYAAGFGLRFRRFQIDAGIDISDRVNTISISSVYYFGR